MVERCSTLERELEIQIFNTSNYLYFTLKVNQIVNQKFKKKTILGGFKTKQKYARLCPANQKLTLWVDTKFQTKKPLLIKNKITAVKKLHSKKALEWKFMVYSS